LAQVPAAVPIAHSRSAEIVAVRDGSTRHFPDAGSAYTQDANMSLSTEVSSGLKIEQLSYSYGGPEVSLLKCTIGDLLSSAARLYPLETVLISRHQRQQLSYSEFDKQVRDVAKGLLGLGVERGDRIALWAANCSEWLVVQYAAAKVGGILVTINPSYRTSELKVILETAECRTLITSQSFRNCDHIEILGQIYSEMSGTSLPLLKDVVVIDAPAPDGMLSWDDLLHKGDAVTEETLVCREQTLVYDDAVSLQFTSGTTGAPKGVLSSHGNLINNAVLAGQRMKFSFRDRLCLPVPLFHCFGMVLGSVAAVANGAAIIIPGESFEAGSTLEAIEEERCTVIYGVPTMFVRQLEHPRIQSSDLRSLRTGNIGGAPCLAALVKRIMEEMHCPEITIGYGLTEASPLITLTSVTDPLKARLTTVGRELPCTELKIVDPVSNVTVPRGVVGELCTRGYGVMKGYYKDAEATSKAIDADGWLHTRDLASLDSDGYCSIVGRIKDVIIRGGEKIYPREIEELLLACAEISEAYVVGVPDADYGEEIAAWVKLASGSIMDDTGIRRFCYGKIASYKIPRQIRIVNEIPTTASGKVQKHLIRESFVCKAG
jgi:fatty-acyl-CoA synthase